MSDTTVERAMAHVQPILDDLGLTLWDCEWSGGVFKVTVDKPATQPGHLGGVTLDEISLATRLINRAFEHAEPCPLPENYSMEVSSPGLERALRRPQHFTAVVGAAIAVRLRDPQDGVRRAKGTLVSAGDDRFVVLDAESGVEHSVTYGQVDRAHTVFEWGPAPKPGGPKSKPKAGGSKSAAAASAQPAADDSVAIDEERAAL